MIGHTQNFVRYTGEFRYELLLESCCLWSQHEHKGHQKFAGILCKRVFFHHIPSPAFPRLHMLCDRISLLRRCVVDVAAIDQMNILQAALRAMEGAVTALPCSPPDYLLVDGNQLPGAFRKDSSQTVVRGDSKSTVIAAASILAKV